MKKVLMLLGPTAVGKTFMSVQLASIFKGEIISSDSVQVFKGLNIGSAKVTKKEMNGIVHHGIDICEGTENFSAFQFVEYTKQKIDEITAKGKLPILVGGTGLYVKALVEGFDFGSAIRDESLRTDLEILAQNKGVEALFKLLEEKAPEMAITIDKFNKTRIVRALEIAQGGGVKSKIAVDIDPLVIALVRPRESLYEAIDKRVDIMLQKGLVEEVRKLVDLGLSKKHQSMSAIGYKEVLQYLDGEFDYDQMVEIIKQHSRNYAKRQITFLKSMKNIKFVDTTYKEKALEEILELIGEWNKNE